MSGVHSDRVVTIRLIGVREEHLPRLRTAIKSHIHRFANRLEIEGADIDEEKSDGKSRKKKFSRR